MTTPNERLFAATVRRAVLLQRTASGEAAEILRLLEQTIVPSVLAVLARRLADIEARRFASAATLLRSRAYLAMLTEMRAAIGKGATKLTKRAEQGLIEIAKAEAAWNGKLLGSLVKQANIRIGLAAPSVAELRALATSSPFQGAHLAKWVEQVGTRTAAAVEKQVAIGLSQGESVATMLPRIRGTKAARFRDGVFATTRREVETVVRTAVVHVASETRLAVLRENEDIVTGWYWDATLDLRTCPICGAYEEESRRKPFALDDGRKPPAHPLCRCGILPALGTGTPGERASMFGPVPATTTFGDFLGGLPAADVDDVLGKTRGSLFRAGKISLGDMIDQRGRPLSVEQLSKL